MIGCSSARLRRRILRGFLPVAVAALGLSAGTLFAQNGSFELTFAVPHPSEHHSIAPVSIPVGTSGAADIGMVAVSFRTLTNGSTSSVSWISLQATSDGTFDDSWVSDIRVYFEPESVSALSPGKAMYDHGGGYDDVRVDTGGPHTFSGATVTIPLDPTVVKFTRPGGGPNYLYVVFDLSASADTTTNLGCEVTGIRYGLPDVGNSATATPAAHGTKVNLDDYTVSLTATGIAPATAEQGQQNVPVLRLEYEALDSEVTAYFDTIQVTSTSDRHADIAAAGVLLYEDTDGDGLFDPDNDELLTGGTMGRTSGTVLLSVFDPIAVTHTGKTLFVVVNLAVTAVVGNDVSLRVENPSAAHTFRDRIMDDSIYAGEDFAFVPPGYPYDQTGYILATDPSPAAGNSFEVTGYTSFLVTSVDPGNWAENIPKSASVTAEFNKAVDPATLAGNFTLTGSVSGAIAGSITYDSGNRRATFDPTADFEWGETVTAVVSTDVLDGSGNPLEIQKTWSFTIAPAVHPVVLNTSPVNGQSGIARTANVTATFSKVMAAGTITGATFTLSGSASGPIAGVVSYNADNRTATFDPTASFEWGETITATITTGVQATDGLALQENTVFVFDIVIAIYPQVLNTSPLPDATSVPRSDSVTATFSKDMDAGTITGATFTLSGSISGAIAGAVSYNAGNRTATFDPTADFAWGETITATISTAAQAYDGLALQANKVWTFQAVTPVYPQVLYTSPAEDATEVPRAQSVTATFSKDMDGGTIESPATNFTLSGSLSGPIAGTVSYNAGSRTATFDPADYFEWEETVTVTISTAVQAADGLALQAVKQWSFTVRPSNYPFVSSTTPADGSSGVSVDSPIKASFTKTMDVNTLAANFSVRDSSGAAVAGTLSYDANTSTVTFELLPDARLAYNTQYTVTVTGGDDGVKDVDGLPLTVPQKVWSFRTFGDFEKATVTNNRIVSGGNQQVLIFIPEPASGAATRISVQVFTTSGRLVRTFYRDTSYSAVSPNPIPWDGTNEQGRPLGPGMYFVQVRAGNSKQVLRVLIVR